MRHGPFLVHLVFSNEKAYEMTPPIAKFPCRIDMVTELSRKHYVEVLLTFSLFTLSVPVFVD